MWNTETVNKAINVLKSHSVPGILTEGMSGTFDIKTGNYKIESFKVTDNPVLNIPELYKAKGLPFLPNIPFLPSLPPLPFFPFLPGLPGVPGAPEPEPDKWVTKFIDPVIKFITMGKAVSKVDVYLLSGKVTGTVKAEIGNNSIEGKSYTENTRTGETTTPKLIAGSARIIPYYIEKLFMKDVQKTLGNITNKAPPVDPNIYIEANGNFETTGYISMIQKILDLLLKGTIYVDDDITADATYEWFGTKKQTKTFHITAWLPVSNVDWHLW